MCGIMGYVAPGQRMEAWFPTALRTAGHRGPDGEGVWTPGSTRPLDLHKESLPSGVGVALGHLRLSILDLSEAGAQPMVVPSRAAITLNGEIYNYLELRKELESEGWTFGSGTDTEVLLKGWLAWGMDLFPRLNGMWAFALWDEATQSLLLCRDPFGEKPLFWVPWRGGVAFASEVKQLAAFPEVHLRLDHHEAARFLVTGRPYDGPSSWFEGIHQLPPGTWMRIGPGGIQQGTYFDLESRVAQVGALGGAEDWAEGFRDVLERAVSLRMRSDVAVGGCLSAGLDSSVLLAHAVGVAAPGSFHSFTLCNENRTLDEGREAQAFARKKGAHWHGLHANAPEFAGLWDRMTWHQEAPLPSTSLFGQWKVLERARAEGVIVLLDGQGADEVLAGYHKFSVARIRRLLGARPLLGLKAGFEFLRHVGAAPTLLSYGYRYFQGGGTTATGRLVLPGLYEGPINPPVHGDLVAMRLADIRQWSLPNLLTFEDRNAMAHSVETRLPFLDPNLVAMALAMPEEVLFQEGWTKWAIRKELDRAGAPEVAWRRGKKQFFAAQSTWMRGALAPQVKSWVENPHPYWERLVTASHMKAFQERWKSSSVGHSMDDQVFKMVSLDRFFHQWFPA